ncbi:MAG: glycosyltransferase family 4 protein [Acidobacteriota bacterium]
MSTRSSNILFLTAHLPVLGLHGGGVRMYHNLRFLAERHRVTLVSFIESERELEWLPQLAELGTEVRTVLRRPLPSAHLLIPKPREHDEYRSPEMASVVQRLLAQKQYDVVQAEFVQMAQHVPLSSRYFKVLTEHEVHFANFFEDCVREKRILHKAKKAYDWMVQLNYEARVCRAFDRVVCMTNEDQACLGRFVPAHKLRTIPIGVDCRYYAPSDSVEARCPNRILFVGNYRHPPNQDAVYHFAEEILPVVRAAVPDAEFCVTGANADLLDRKRLQNAAGVAVAGYLKDVRPAYQQAALFAAPIRVGSGMRVKVLEALSMALPVVGYPLAIQGFQLREGEHCLTASDPSGFARQVIHLLRNPCLRTEIGARARKLIEQHFDWQALRPQFLEVVERSDG